MFHLPSLIKSFFVLLVIGSAIVAATKFSPELKQTAGKVLGTTVNENSQTLPKALQKDVNESVTTAKNAAMNTDVNKVVDLKEKADKVISDYHSLQREIQIQVDRFFSQKKDERKK